MLKITNDFFEITHEGHTLYGYTNGARQYVVVGASFNSAQYTKASRYDTFIGWKRDKRGAVSKAFYEWEAVVSKKLYEEFYGGSR